MLNSKNYFLFFLFVLTNTFYSYAQKKGNERIDSLLNCLNHYKGLCTVPCLADTKKVNLLNRITYEFSSKDPDTALAIGKQALELSQVISWKIGIGSSLHQLGWAYYNKGEYGLSLQQYNKALETWIALDRISNDKEKLLIKNKTSTTLGNMGIVYMTQGDYSKAIEYYMNALKILEELKNSSDENIRVASQNEMARHYGNIGIVYFSQGDFSKALDFYLKALKINEALSNTQKIVANLANIGGVYLSIGDYSNALKYYLKALNINGESGEKNNSSNILGNIGNAYYNQKSYDKALEYYQQALKMDDELKNQSGVARHLSNIGSVYSIQGDQLLKKKDTRNAGIQYASALDYFFKALQMNKELGEKKTVAINFQNIGTVYISLKKFQEGRNYLNEALSIADSIHDLTREMEVRENLSKFYSQTGNYQKGLEYYKEAMALKDSIFNESKTKEITRLEMQYTFGKQQDSLTILQDKKESESKAELEKQKLLRNSIAGGSAILLLSSLLIFYYYKRNRDSQEKRKEISNSLLISETEMKALQAQMNPHFIFNALNSIRKFLANHKSDETDSYIKKFQELMRFVLENSTLQEVPLMNDLNALRSYMEFERLRLDHPFTFEINVDKNIDEENTSIPPLILQPFVENAIWHGLQPKQEPGFIKISISMVDETVTCIVEDNGVGRDLSKSVTEPMVIKKKSLGMKITEQRLKIYSSYKNVKAWFKIIDLFNTEKKPAGTRVELYLPLFA